MDPSSAEGGESGESNLQPPHQSECEQQPSATFPAGVQSVTSAGHHQPEIVKTKSGRVSGKLARYEEAGF